MPTLIRKYKKAVRKIDKLKKLYEKFDKPKIKYCTCCNVILFINLFIVFITDFLLPIIFNYGYNYGDEEFEKDKHILGLILGIIFLFMICIVSCSYTIIIIYSTMRKRYITGDFLSYKQINDDLSLMKTVQLVCGYSFALVYCNLYFWKAIDSFGKLGKPKFYEEIIIPDYKIIGGLSVYMIVKIIIIAISIIGTLKFSSISFFKNDLADFNNLSKNCEYEQVTKINISLEEKTKIVNILKYKEKELNNLNK